MFQPFFQFTLGMGVNIVATQQGATTESVLGPCMASCADQKTTASKARTISTLFATTILTASSMVLYISTSLNHMFPRLSNVSLRVTSYTGCAAVQSARRSSSAKVNFHTGVNPAQGPALKGLGPPTDCLPLFQNITRVPGFTNPPSPQQQPEKLGTNATVSAVCVQGSQEAQTLPNMMPWAPR